MKAQDKAKELIYKHLNYTSSWTTISKPTDVSHQAIFEAGMKMGRAKQCAIISIEEVIEYAKTFGDVTEHDISFYNDVISEIRAFAPPDAKHLLPAVVWDSIAQDDFVFRFGDYCLRVEQMNKKYWWWCIYYKDDHIGFDEPKAKTELEAKLLAEICFVRHWSSHSR